MSQVIGTVKFLLVPSLIEYSLAVDQGKSILPFFRWKVVSVKCQAVVYLQNVVVVMKQQILEVHRDHTCGGLRFRRVITVFLIRN